VKILAEQWPTFKIKILCSLSFSFAVFWRTAKVIHQILKTQQFTFSELIFIYLSTYTYSAMFS